MQRWTENLPKALIPVAGRPFLEWQLEWLASNGIQDVLIAVGYLGSLIMDYVEDGTAWNVRVSYTAEGDRLLGTAGALRRAADSSQLAPVSLVLYGDSYLPIDIGPVIKAFRACGDPAMMTVWRNDGLYQNSNVNFEDGQVISYDKARKGVHRMRYIDYGLSILSRDIILEHTQAERPGDLSCLFRTLSRDGRLAGFEVRERFYEIGSEMGLEALEHHLRGPHRGAP
jgi:NDP-sugar pyrophosphorylase family protein